MGEVKISQKQGEKLGLKPKTPISPVLEKCALRVCAKNSYKNASEDLKTLMGISVGHSTLHRIVQKAEIEPSQSEEKVAAVSVDGERCVCVQKRQEKGSGVIIRQ